MAETLIIRYRFITHDILYLTQCTEGSGVPHTLQFALELFAFLEQLKRHLSSDIRILVLQQTIFPRTSTSRGAVHTAQINICWLHSTRNLSDP